ncbi:DNA polymerase delta subunit 3-like [Microcaecilia unicolor]|uniref:DNA polymerase delta subunit 3 n=1 Tax=Microcaecilia unicolor TaxID=1415580 RepID=A0A6P7XR94_9AMPH|nr:DNA polymerase delta subunit 3-like [Microcaecilia unicolor]
MRELVAAVMDELYLENIDEFVTDQNKIVTYKWLSHTLGVHVNQAKQMLYEYVERKRKESLGVQLHVTYLVTGKLIQNGYTFHKVAVVKEEQLEALKSRLAVTASVHVYSIQKAALKDSGPLFNTDYDIIKTNLQNCNKYSAIQCPAAVRRPLPQVSHPQPPSQASGDPPAGGMLATNGHGPPLAAKAKSQQPKGILGMFSAKMASKPQDRPKESKAEGHEVAAAATSIKPSGKANAVNNFFGKASLKKFKAISEHEEAVEELKPAVSPSAFMAEVKLSSREVPEKPAKKQEPVKAQQKDKKSKLRRGETSDSDSDQELESLNKKRRRIKQPQADSSEDEGVSITQDVKVPSPNYEAVQKTEPEPQPPVLQDQRKERRRKRVLKTKTFVDEEGSMACENDDTMPFTPEMTIQC